MQIDLHIFSRTLGVGGVGNLFKLVKVMVSKICRSKVRGYHLTRSNLLGGWGSIIMMNANRDIALVSS